MTWRFREARRAARNALGYGPAGRSVTVLPDDVFLVSYPRSGNTWLRFLVSNLMIPSPPADFVNIEERAPDIYRNSDRAMLRLPRPRLLKSHEFFDPRYARVVYAVRDPRDVISSYYRWHIRSGVKDVSTGSVFLRHFVDGGLDRYGSWQTHAGGWIGAREGDPTFLLIRYEDILSEPETASERLCSFLNLTRSPAEIQSAVDASNRTKMRELEDVQKVSSPILSGGRKEIPFVGDAGSASAHRCE